MAKSKIANVTLEGVRIVFRNFAGAEGKYNRKGDRNFAAILTPEVASDMARDGWNIKHLQAREEGELPTPYLSVKLKFPEDGNNPPKVVMITSRGRTTLGEDEVALLDWAEIENVDLIVRAFEWEVSGNTGVAAYLKSIYVTIREDDLERKYAEVPDSAQSAMSERDVRNPFASDDERPF